MDSQQAQMMTYMMPAMFGFIFWNLAAGLGVYIFAGNIIGYLLQLAMNNTPHAREVRAHLAKRAEKKRKR
jgi:YidC/Oxa1 family membrane protein insertase